VDVEDQYSSNGKVHKAIWVHLRQNEPRTETFYPVTVYHSQCKKKKNDFFLLYVKALNCVCVQGPELISGAGPSSNRNNKI